MMFPENNSWIFGRTIREYFLKRYARIRFKNSELLKFSVLANQTFCFSRLYGTIITITNMLTILYYDAFEFENMSKKEILPKVFAITFRFLFWENFLTYSLPQDCSYETSRSLHNVDKRHSMFWSSDVEGYQKLVQREQPSWKFEFKISNCGNFTISMWEIYYFKKFNCFVVWPWYILGRHKELWENLSKSYGNSSLNKCVRKELYDLW